MAYTGRIGLNATADTDDVVIKEDLNQVIKSKAALARNLYRLFGEGLVSGGADDFSDFSDGTHYPTCALLILDDSGEVWFYDITTEPTIDMSGWTTGTGKLYAIIDLDSTNYASNYPAKGGRTDVLFKALDSATSAPAHSLLLGSGTGTAGTSYSAFTAASGIRVSLDINSSTFDSIQLNDTAGDHSATLSVSADLAANRVISIIDPGVNADFVLTAAAQTVAGIKTFSSNPILSGLTASKLIGTDGSKATQSIDFGDGVELSGTNLQVDYNTTNLKITSTELDTIQSIATSASPTFVGLTLSGLTASKLIGTNGSKATQSIDFGDGVELSGTNLQVDYNTTNLKITSTELDTIQSIATSASPTFAGLTVTGDIYTVQMTDYSSTTTASGWASFGTKSVYYKKVGKLVYVNVYISGTSNAGTASFTVPYAAAAAPAYQGNFAYQVTDNTVATYGFVRISASSSTVDIYRFDQAAFASSGIKAVLASFWYEAA